MGFNFGAFVGGLSQQIVGDIEKEEERLAKMEEMAQTEAMRQRAAAASSRRAKQEATETLMGALSMFYTPEVAAQIAQRGEKAAEFALDAGQKAMQKGINPNTLYKLPTVGDDLSNPVNQDKINGIISTAPPKVSETVSALGEGAPTPTITGFMPDAAAFQALYGEPTEIANSYGTAIAQVSQRILREKDPAKRATLEAERDALISDYSKMEAAGREPEETGGSVFNFGTLPAVVNEALKNARTRLLFKTDDIDGSILNLTEGNQHNAYIADLLAAETLESMYGSFGDPSLNARIVTLRSQANRDLIDYGRRTIAGGTSARLKNESSPEAIEEGLVKGKYNIGDVVALRDDNGNVVEFIVYTGVPEVVDNRAYYFVRGQ